jgi:protein-S-isoprenylcysteine O-methyltransferase Ste14
MDAPRLAIASVFCGPVVSEVLRRPFKLHGILSWCHFPLFTILGYRNSKWLQSMDPCKLIAKNESIWNIITGTCFVSIGIGWTMRWWAVHTLGPAFNLRFGDSGGKTRGKIASTGPYAYIRHPGVGSFLWTCPPAALVASGSVMYGMAVFGLFAFTYTPLNKMDEQQLAKALPEYREYMERVRYRYLPGIY